MLPWRALGAGSEPAAVHRDRRPSDERGVVRTEPGDGCTYFFRLTQATHGCALHYDSLALDEVTVRPHGGAAIVTGHEMDTIQYEGHPMQGNYRTTLVFVEELGRWRLASLQYSPIAPPPGVGTGAQQAQQH